MKNLTLCLCLLLLFLFSQPALAVSAQLPIMLDGINISAPDYPADNQPAILAQEHSGTAYVRSAGRSNKSPLAMAKTP